MVYEIIFDEVILKQLRKVGKKLEVREALSRMLDKIEEKGPDAGNLIDSKLRIYELKQKRPPIRLYYRHVKKEIYVFEYEIKRSKLRQQKTIDKLKEKTRNQDQTD